MASNHSPLKGVKSKARRLTDEEKNGHAIPSIAPKQEPLDREGLFVAFSSFTEAQTSGRIGYWVDCPLPAYQGLRVLYRTNNPTRVRRERPQYSEPAEIVQGRARLASLDLELQASYTPEKDMERAEILRDLVARKRVLDDEFTKELAHHMAHFVIDVEPWPLEDVPKPDPANPESFEPLTTELEDLFDWMQEDGYKAALQKSAKNS